MKQLITHDELVDKLVKPGADIMAALTPEKAHLLHMAIGIPSEAGELADVIKKWAIYGQSLDLNSIVEELGDLEFFLQGLRRSLGIAREDTLDANIAKLLVRYPQLRYSDKDAEERKDKRTPLPDLLR